MAAEVEVERHGGLSTLAEADTTSLAAKAEAEVKARYAIARRFPRTLDDVRTRLLAECKRPEFAKAARWKLPRGGKELRGPSIRFAEAAMYAMTNLAVEAPVVYEDDRKRVLRVAVSDMERNAHWSKDITVEKTALRRRLRAGEQPISRRKNSQGDELFVVVAQEDDVAMREGQLISKAARDLILRHVPADIKDECMAVCAAVADAKFAEDPTAARKKLVDAFASIGVTAAELTEYLGHELTALVADEHDELSAIYTMIKEGVTRWRDVVAEQRGEAAGGDEAERKTSKLRAELDKRMAARRAKKNGDEPEAETPEAAVDPETDCGCPDAPAGEHLPGCAKIGGAS